MIVKSFNLRFKLCCQKSGGARHRFLLRLIIARPLCFLAAVALLLVSSESAHFCHFYTSKSTYFSLWNFELSKSRRAKIACGQKPGCLPDLVPCPPRAL